MDSLDFLGLDQDFWIWTFGFLRIWIRNFWIWTFGFLRIWIRTFGFGLFGFLKIWIRTFGLSAFLRIVVDRDVKMGFLPAAGAAFSCPVVNLRCLALFPVFWIERNRFLPGPSITFAEIFKDV